MKRAKRRRWLRRIVFGVIAVACTVLVGGWLALRHIPDWYRPLTVPADRLQQVRNSLTHRFSDISDRMVAGAAFEVSITDQEVTEWLAARGHIWPGADQWLPPWLTGPVVAFVPGRIVLAAHLNRDGWESITAAHFSVGVDGGALVIRLERVTAGALPIPLALLADPLDGLVHTDRLDVESLPDEMAQAVNGLRAGDALGFLSGGQRLAGPFVWKNGDRPYRVRDVQIGEGWLHVVIEPL